MKIITRTKWAVTISVILLIITVFVLVLISRRVDRAVQGNIVALEITRHVFDLEILLKDYIASNNPYSLTEWSSSQDNLARILFQQDPQTSEEQVIIGALLRQNERLRSSFSDFTSNRLLMQEGDDKELVEQDFSNQIFIVTQSMLTGAFRFAANSNVSLILAQQQGALITAFMVLLVLLTFVFNNLFIYRQVVSPLYDMSEVLGKVAAGDFSQVLEIKRDDELGDVAMSVNNMTKQLSSLYVDLERKVIIKTRELENKVKELANAKAKDDAILSNIGDGLVVTDIKLNLIYINKAALKMLKLKPADVIGKKWHEIINVENKEGKNIAHESLPIHNALLKKKVFSSNDYGFIRKNKTSFPVAITASPIMVDNIVNGLIVVFRDATKERDVDKAKTEFVSLASHQLRTPLSMINWYSEMLLDGDAGKLNKEQKAHLKIIYDGNKRMISLVNSLLNVSRIDLGTFSIEPEKINLCKIITDVVNEVEVLVKEKKQDLKWSCPTTIKNLILDKNLTNIIIQNLLSNAVKYTPEKGKVVLEVVEKNKGTIIGKKKLLKKSIVIKVKDTGYGIPKNQQDKIFSKLFRAENIRKMDTQGTGLGLYIVKSIVENSGGQIWFESIVNKGSTFYVAIPRSGMKKRAGTKGLS